MSAVLAGGPADLQGHAVGVVVGTVYRDVALGEPAAGQVAGAQLGAAEVACDHAAHLADTGPLQHLEHRAPRGAEPAIVLIN